MKKVLLLLLFVFSSCFVYTQKLILGKQTFELHNVTGEIIKFQGKKVLKIERDLKALPFDEKNLETTVDDRHYARLIDINDFENGTI